MYEGERIREPFPVFKNRHRDTSEHCLSIRIFKSESAQMRERNVSGQVIDENPSL